MTPEQMMCKALCTCDNNGQSLGLAFHLGHCVYRGHPFVRDVVLATIRNVNQAATERAAKILDEYGDSIHPDVAGVAHVMRRIAARIRNQDPTDA